MHSCRGCQVDTDRETWRAWRPGCQRRLSALLPIALFGLATFAYLTPHQKSLRGNEAPWYLCLWIRIEVNASASHEQLDSCQLQDWNFEVVPMNSHMLRLFFLVLDCSNLERCASPTRINGIWMKLVETEMLSGQGLSGKVKLCENMWEPRRQNASKKPETMEGRCSPRLFVALWSSRRRTATCLSWGHNYRQLGYQLCRYFSCWFGLLSTVSWTTFSPGL